MKFEITVNVAPGEARQVNIRSIDHMARASEEMQAKGYRTEIFLRAGGTLYSIDTIEETQQRCKDLGAASVKEQYQKQRTETYKLHPGDPWKPIETAPKDGVRKLYVAVFSDVGLIYDFDWSVTWSSDHTGAGFMGGFVEPYNETNWTHWAYMDEPLQFAPRSWRRGYREELARYVAEAERLRALVTRLGIDQNDN